MTENPLHGRFDDMVNAMMRPTPPPSATLRVADLYSGDGQLARIIKDAGMDVVYSHHPKSWKEIFDFDDVPYIDIVTAVMPDSKRERWNAFGFVVRFLRVRRPDTFLLIGTEQSYGNEFVSFVEQESRDYGYEVISINADSGVFESNEPLAFVVGMLNIDPSELPIFSANWEGGNEDSQASALSVMVGRVGRVVKGEGWA